MICDEKWNWEFRDDGVSVDAGKSRSF